ncbi:CmpA/NrtA family ABC transporter substrate-binding protein [Mesobacterium pallidum]|uniref:CmpA/NrtA family ABC transporter substrate-binding protein n=1 Tax=Mesobacterium pallidum TaxID=2872037 RepID=UPI001EE2A83E|nr:CmpA/NrtA family ABC transporter substrate-binding protein [Mesobacterium pallidum]
MNAGLRIPVAYVPLVDAAPLIIAQELGFAAEEGITLELMKAPSWSVVRDALTLGQADLAHLLAPLPVAIGLGLAPSPVQLEVAMVLSINGSVIGAARDLAARVAKAAPTAGFLDAFSVGRALLSVGPRALRVGIPFPFSTHYELVDYWLGAIDPAARDRLQIHTVPPPRMSEAVAAGEIDLFCVGEPWGSEAVEEGTAELLLPGRAIWNHAPEKVLALRKGWDLEQPAALHAAIRAIWRAGRWLSQPGNRSSASEILSRPEYLDVSPLLIDRALSGRFVVSPRGERRDCPVFVCFHQGAANFPWRSQGRWFGHRLALRTGLEQGDAIATAGAIFRSDIYRAAMAEMPSALPTSSSKVEGGLPQDLAVPAVGGDLILRADRFFDGAVFDPSLPE